ncbi:MAG: WBM0748 family T4SS-associated protein [Wolbachia sp.]
MSLKNKISELIEQQFSIKYHDNYLAYTIHKWAANEISSSIAFCIVGCGNCKIGYQDVANSFNITKEEIDQGNIARIESKIKSEAEKSGSEFSELIARMDQSLREQSGKSIVQILDSSAEEMLRSLCNSTAYNSPEPQELSASSEELATEGLETTANSDLLST